MSLALLCIFRIEFVRRSDANALVALVYSAWVERDSPKRSAHLLRVVRLRSFFSKTPAAPKPAVNEELQTHKASTAEDAGALHPAQWV